MSIATQAHTFVALHPQRDLTLYLNSIWQQYFSDVPYANDVRIAYSRPWKSRLGLIRMSLDCSHSFIGINSLLQHTEVPDVVLIVTIAHELVHYAHGFGSPLPQLYDHPHANNVVDIELERRKLGDALSECNSWIDEQWYNFYKAQRETRNLSNIQRSRVKRKAG
jgi:hypothetical protein